MAGFALATVVYEAKAALYAAALALWPQDSHEMGVHWGTLVVPSDQYVEFHAASTDQSTATMGPTRGREETIQLELLWFTARWGDVDAAKEAEGYTIARIQELEQLCRVTDTTLGGVVRECALVSVATDDGLIRDAGTAQGRLFVARTVFQAKARVRS